MKISCLQENLAKGLAVVGRAVGSRSTLPQASHVLLASDEGRLKLVATNLEIAITCWIGAQVEEEGAVTVPARLLTDFVSSLPNERIDMSLPARGRQLNLNCARNEASVSGMDAADFPPVPPVDDGFRLKLDAKALRTAIEHVEFAAAADDTRPALPALHTLLHHSPLSLPPRRLQARPQRGGLGEGGGDHPRPRHARANAPPRGGRGAAGAGVQRRPLAGAVPAEVRGDGGDPGPGYLPQLLAAHPRQLRLSRPHRHAAVPPGDAHRRYLRPRRLRHRPHPAPAGRGRCAGEADHLRPRRGDRRAPRRDGREDRG